NYSIEYVIVFFLQAEDGIRDRNVTGVQTCALPIFDKDQHNTMVHSMYNANIFYCTPLFSTHEDLKTKFNQNHINNSSIWIDPSNITISDNNTHNITYDKFGMDVYLHSQPTFLKTIQFKNPKEILTKRIIDKRYV